MAATATWSGTWTVLNIDYTKNPKTGPNLPNVASFQGEALKNVDLPELTAFIQAAADGWGLSYNAAKALVYICMTAAMNREDPLALSGTSRTYGTGPGA